MNSTINFLELYENIFQILPSGNIQKLLESCYRIIGVPILAVDVTYNLLGIAPQQKTGNEYWDYFLEHRCYGTDQTVKLYEEGIMQSVNQKKAPYIINWGTMNKDFPKIQGVVKVNDIVEGYVTMQCTEEEITPEKMKAMEIIQDALSFFYKDNSNESSMHHTYQKVFIGELLNNRILTEKQLELWLRNMENQLEAPFRIVAVGTTDTNEKNVLSYICKTILQFFPYQLALIQNNVLYILQFRLNLAQHIQIAEKQFNLILQKFNAHCGTSNYFHNLLDTADYKIQAEDALNLGRHPNGNYRIYNYEDYYLPAILSPRIKQMPRRNYLSPIIRQLEEYDKKNSTDFLTTLCIYVKNICRTADTADALHIHRNTLLYRINKIEELTDASLKDYDTFIHLMISFYMMNYK